MTVNTTLSYRKVILAYIAWWALWCVAQTFLLAQSFALHLAWQDAIVTQLITAIAGYAINTSMHAYQPSERNAFFVVFQSLALAGVSVWVMHLIMGWLVPEEKPYLAWLTTTLEFRFGYVWLMLLLVAVLTWFWVYIADSVESAQRKEAAAQLARDAELANLRRQLQPHFLFNSLNSISALVSHQPEQARTMVQQLSDFLRGTLRQDDHSLVTLEEELHHLALYLAIEKVRFGHRLQTTMAIADETRVARMPSLLLQPIMENAIKFGLYDTVGETTISVSATLNEQHLVIHITNPFDSGTVMNRPGTGFGLTSVQRRLYLLYLRNDLLATERNETEFITTVRIPQ
ncbi:MAG TPA: sensor histidine kinase [Cytophagales bacterium]|nr:sensor histidine kinase [Cytophagales bacterium]HQQ81814.1 histidine kinase [Cyclobacteriaceae bacterium]